MDIVQSLAVRIAIGADHAGFALKEHLKSTLARLGHAVDDHGTDSNASVDYPPICAAVGRAVVSGTADRGIVLGGSGQGEQIAANKVIGIRAALCNDLYTARLSREHNDANVLAMGGRIVACGLADEILTLWLATTFQARRHQHRLAQVAALERSPGSQWPHKPRPVPGVRSPRPTPTSPPRFVTSGIGRTVDSNSSRPRTSSAAPSSRPPVRC